MFFFFLSFFDKLSHIRGYLETPGCHAQTHAYPHAHARTHTLAEREDKSTPLSKFQLRGENLEIRCKDVVCG